MNKHSLHAPLPPAKDAHQFQSVSEEVAQRLICSSDLLRDLPATTCTQLLCAGRVLHVPANAYLFNQGSDAKTCYVLLSGEIRLLLLTPDGKRVIIDIIGPGMHLGFFVALAGKQYPLSAEIVEDSEIYSWDAEVMRAVVLDTPQLTMNTLGALTKRVMCLQTKIQQLATEHVEQRIAYSLLSLAQHLGSGRTDGVMIEMPITHRDLAEMSGTNIYSVSRILNKWEAEGIVSTGRKRIVLRSPERLPCREQ